MRKRTEQRSIKGFVATEFVVAATVAAILSGLLLPVASNGITNQQTQRDTGIAWVSGSGGIRGR